MDKHKACAENGEQRLLSILEGTRAGTWEWNVQTGETIFNERWAQIIGYALAEISPTSIQTWVDFTHPDDLASSNEQLQRHFRGELGYYECEARMKHKDGHWVWVLDRGKVFSWSENGRPLWMFGTHQDVTDRKLTENALKESQERLHLFIEHAPASLAMFDRDMRYLSASRRWRNDYGLGRRELIGESHYIIFPEISAEWKEAHRRGLAGEVLHSDGDRFDRVDGSVQWVKWEIRPWYDATGQIGGIVIFTEDITERMLAQEALAESERRYRILFDEAAHGTAVADAETGIILACNRKLAAMIGWPVDEVVGRHQSFLHEGDAATDNFSGTFKRHRSEADGRILESHLRARDGRLIDVEILSTRLQVGDRGLLQGFFYDISERKKLLEDYRRSAQLAALGTIAAGVAHEVNNPIQGILNYATLISDAPEKAEKVANLAQRIIKESGRIAQITRDLLFYSRDGRSEFVRTDIVALVASAISLTKLNLRREGVDVVHDMPSAPVVMTVNPQGIHQIVINLLNNAADAVRDKSGTAGTKVIRVSGRVDETGAQPRFILEFLDFGTGIPADLMNKVRDAFFTTKQESKGTGLGLSIVGDIVAKHEGTLEIESEEYQYTKIIVGLPLKS